MSKFFMPDGQKEIEKEEFLYYYSNLYFVRNNKTVEDYILKIFDIDINDYTEEHIKNILAWKTGSIIQEDFCEEKIKYKKDYIKGKKCIKPYGKIINLSDVLAALKVAIEREKKQNDDNEKLRGFMSAFYNEREATIKGIGPVYALTLRFFVSRGNEPIYDSFARQALWSITEKKSQLPNNPTYNNIIEIYNDYIKMMKKEFAYEYDNRIVNPEEWRKVDQALWAYGHCFHVKEFAKYNK